MPSIFFDLEPFDRWHRIEIEEMLREIETGATQVKIVTLRKAADFTVGFGGGSLNDSLWTIISPPKFTNDFVWDMNDAPTGLQPGLYCSLRAGLYNSRSHRSFCYWLRYNEMIDKFPLDLARVTYSFVGAISSGLRSRMVQQFAANPRLTEKSGSKVVLGTQYSTDRGWRQNGIMRTAFGVRNSYSVPAAMESGAFGCSKSWKRNACPLSSATTTFYRRARGGRNVRYALENATCRSSTKLSLLRNHGGSKWRYARREWEQHFGRTRILDEIGRLISNLRSDTGTLQKIRAAAFRGEAKLRSAIPRKIRQLKNSFRG